MKSDFEIKLMKKIGFLSAQITCLLTNQRELIKKINTLEKKSLKKLECCSNAFKQTKEACFVLREELGDCRGVFTDSTEF